MFILNSFGMMIFFGISHTKTDHYLIVFKQQLNQNYLKKYLIETIVNNNLFISIYNFFNIDRYNS